MCKNTRILHKYLPGNSISKNLVKSGVHSGLEISMH